MPSPSPPEKRDSWWPVDQCLSGERRCWWHSGDKNASEAFPDKTSTNKRTAEELFPAACHASVASSISWAFTEPYLQAHSYLLRWFKIFFLHLIGNVLGPGFKLFFFCPSPWDNRLEVLDTKPLATCKEKGSLNNVCMSVSQVSARQPDWGRQKLALKKKQENAYTLRRSKGKRWRKRGIGWKPTEGTFLCPFFFKMGLTENSWYSRRNHSWKREGLIANGENAIVRRALGSCCVGWCQGASQGQECESGGEG